MFNQGFLCSGFTGNSVHVLLKPSCEVVHLKNFKFKKFNFWFDLAASRVFGRYSVLFSKWSFLRAYQIQDGECRLLFLT